MKKAEKKQWVKALRSGEYKQCRGQLRQYRAGSESFCCIGVLADLTVDGDWEDLQLYPRTSNGLPIDEHDICRQHGISNYEAQLIELNDGRSNSLWYYDTDSKKTFKQIADFIEEHIPTDEEALARAAQTTERTR